jgi:hypothetical protein
MIDGYSGQQARAAKSGMDVESDFFHRNKKNRKPATSMTIPARSQATAFAPPGFSV